MNSIAKDLAIGLDVETSASGVHRAHRHRGTAGTSSSTTATVPADAVILTSPIPQSLALLVDAGLDFDGRRSAPSTTARSVCSRCSTAPAPCRHREVCRTATTRSASSATTRRRGSARCRPSRSTPTRPGATRTGTTTTASTSSLPRAQPWLGDASSSRRRSRSGASPTTVDPGPTRAGRRRAPARAGRRCVRRPEGRRRPQLRPRRRPALLASDAAPCSCNRNRHSATPSVQIQRCPTRRSLRDRR